MFGREEHAQVNLWVLAPDAVDTSVPLDDAHRVPRQVVVDDLPGLLQVDTFRKHISGEQDVVVVLILGNPGIVESTSRARRKLGNRSSPRRLMNATGLP